MAAIEFGTVGEIIVRLESFGHHKQDVEVRAVYVIISRRPKPPYPVNQSHNNLLVTPAFELQGGISYRFSFFHKEDGANICWDSMYVTWGRSNRKDSMTNRFGRVLTKFSFDEFVRFQEDFTAPTTGIYYFGIVVKDVDVNRGSDMIFDDFQLKPITACNLASDIKKGRA